MGMRFEVGGTYSCADCGFDSVKILRRTNKFVVVNNGINTWRTKIHTDENGNEYVVDTSAPKSCHYVLKWSAAWPD